MEFENLIYEKQDRVALLTINRPEKRNALNRALRLEMERVQEMVARDPEVGVLVITGAGDKAFAAGSDLEELSRMEPLEVYHFLNTLAQRLYTRFEELDLPVIALVNGLCLGAGNEIALACDIRIASDQARFGQPEINLGIIPGSGATQRLSRLVGTGKARELIFTGDIIDAQEALAIGLVNRVVPHQELYDQGMALARRIAAKSAFALKMAKRSLRMAQEVGLTPGLGFEALAETACFNHPDHEEGMRAFFQKRKPTFNR